jgi:hypothetical protein
MPRGRPRLGKAAPRARKPDALAQLPLTRAMEAHFQALLVGGGSPETVRGRRVALRQFIAWADERGLAEPGQAPSTVAGLSLFCRASVAFLSPDHRSGRATRGLPAGAAQRAARYSATPRCVIMMA